MTSLDSRSLEQRRWLVRSMAASGRGHLASACSILEICRVLYHDVLRIDPDAPAWPERDRFILSKGHGCLALYLQLAERGFFPLEELLQVSHDGAPLGGHPEAGRAPGIEWSTGSLGHGLSVGLGMAVAARLHGAKHRVFVLLGDGECNEGSVWEAALAAVQHRATNLVALVDYNRQQCYAATEAVVALEPLRAKWESFGWAVAEVDGHDVAALRATLGAAPLADVRPMVVICHTVKGKGFPELEGNPVWHHSAKFTPADATRLLAQLDAAESAAATTGNGDA
ncbi:MAG: transketolase [Deltaproteobacteria bacterium]|nr:transketolase [Deltaproteobacteria bacterium]